MLIEGLTPDEIMELPADHLDLMVFTGQPIVLRAGSAEVLCEFVRRKDSLVLDLAHIDGGGEGVLPTLSSLAHRYASRERLPAIEWFVYATNCARPNFKLRRVLERRGLRGEENRPW